MPAPAIVIPAYNRPNCLKRLLQSVAQAHYEEKNIQLLISIDAGDNEEVIQLAEKFRWAHGQLEIIRQPAHLGLKAHILQCGALALKYGSVIVLEDDLFVSPWVYNYTQQALNFIGQNPDENVAGISLFNYEVDEAAFCPFEAYNDGSDNYYMQVASSWGQCWTAQQWQAFTNWYNANQKAGNNEAIPGYLEKWGEHSWKKHFIRYLIATNKYFLFPQISLSTNFGDPGTNTDRQGLFQSRLLTAPKTFVFKKLSDSLSVYDGSFEWKEKCLKSTNPFFQKWDFELDLHGTKKLSQVKTSYLLSSKKCNNPVVTFGASLRPLALNVVYQQSGDVLSLGKTSDFEETAVDPALFYGSVASVLDLVFEEKIKALSEKRIADKITEFRQHEEYKEMGVMVINNEEGDAYLNTLNSILAQNYPFVNLYLVNETTTTIEREILSKFKDPIVLSYTDDGFDFSAFSKFLSSTYSQYFVQVYSGDTFEPNTFHSVNTVFKKYNHVHWLSGLSNNQADGAISYKRLNKNIFLQRVNHARPTGLVPASVFFTRYLFEKATDKFAPKASFNPALLWLAMFNYESPYIINQKLGNAGSGRNNERINATNEKPKWSVLDSLAFLPFVANTPVLRSFFLKRQQLTPVIRYDSNSNSNFFSNY